MSIEQQEANNLFSSKQDSHNDLTVEEIEDILRYAKEQGINSAATAKLLRRIRLKREASYKNQQSENEM